MPSTDSVAPVTSVFLSRMRKRGAARAVPESEASVGPGSLEGRQLAIAEGLAPLCQPFDWNLSDSDDDEDQNDEEGPSFALLDAPKKHSFLSSSALLPSHISRCLRRAGARLPSQERPLDLAAWRGRLKLR